MRPAPVGGTVGGMIGGNNTSGNNTNRADPRLVWLASVLAAMVVVIYLAHG
jgi:hypothetical protein